MFALFIYGEFLSRHLRIFLNLGIIIIFLLWGQKDLMINSSQSKTSAILTSFSTLFFFTSNSSSARQSRVCFSNKMFTNQLMWVHSHSHGAEKEQGSLIFRKLIIAKIRPHFHLPFTFTSVRGVVTKLRSHARAVSARALAIIRDNVHSPSRFQILIRSLQLCSILGSIHPVMFF